MDPTKGFTIQSPEGKTTITPVVSEGATETKVTEQVAGVSANTASSVDSIIRPVYNGAQTFQAIRSLSSPEKYSWTVKLAEGQKLKSIDSEHAEVVNEDGSMAFLITAEGAHDVTGVSVPVSLAVSGNVLTLTVAIKSGQFTLPIISGQGWETKYVVPTYIELPEDEYEIKQREEEEKLLEEATESSEPPPPPKTPLTPLQGQKMIQPRLGGTQNTAAPPYPPSGGAEASKIRTFTVDERFVCATLTCQYYRLYVRNPSFLRGFDWSRWETGTEVHCGWSQHWTYALIILVSQHGCDFAGPSKVWKGENKHLTIWGRFRITAPVATEWVEWTEEKLVSLQVWVWPNGFQERYITDWPCPPYLCF
jgi:hypothetical protein